MSDLSFHVREFVPACKDGDEMLLRVGLLKARDYAAAVRGRSLSGHACDLAATVHDVAGEYVFADVSTAQLKMALTYCRAIMQGALTAESMEVAS